MKARILSAVLALFFLTQGNAQSTVIEAKKVKANDSLYINGKWVKSITIDTSLASVTDRDISSAAAIKKYVLNHIPSFLSGALFDTTTLQPRFNQRVKYGDTASMLANRFKISDTSFLLGNYARYGWVVKYTDTASMLGNLLRKTDTAYALSNRLKISDTANAFVNHLRKSDTATMLSPYVHFQAAVKYYDTASMLSNLLRKTDTAYALSNRLKISDTANAFSNYLRKTTLILQGEGGTGYTSLASLAGDAAFTGKYLALTGGTLTGSLSGTIGIFNSSYTNTKQLQIQSQGNIPGISLISSGNGNAAFVTNYIGANITSILVGSGTNTPTTEVLRFDNTTGNTSTTYSFTAAGITNNSTVLTSGVNGNDNNIYLNGYNSGNVRITTNAGNSSGYNGISIIANNTGVNSLPSWALDLGGNNAVLTGSDFFGIGRKPNGGSYTTFFSIANTGATSFSNSVTALSYNATGTPSNTVGTGSFLSMGNGGGTTSNNILQTGVGQFLFWGYNGSSWVNTFAINNSTYAASFAGSVSGAAASFTTGTFSSDLTLSATDGRVSGGTAAGRAIWGNNGFTSYIVATGASYSGTPNTMTFITNATLALTINSSQQSIFAASSGIGSIYTIGSYKTFNIDGSSGGSGGLLSVAYNGTVYGQFYTNSSQGLNISTVGTGTMTSYAYTYVVNTNGTNALTINSVQASTFSANLQSNQSSNSSWIFQALNGSGVTLGGFYRNGAGDGAMYLYNHSGTGTVSFDGTSGIGSLAGSLTLPYIIANTAGSAFYSIDMKNGGNSINFWNFTNNYSSSIQDIASGSGNSELYIQTQQLKISYLGTGTVYSNGSILTNTNPSDRRLKNGIFDLKYGLTEVLKLQPKSFYYNSDSTHSTLKYGFIAQEVLQVMPDMVRKLNKDSDLLGLETDGIYVTMVNAIKELAEKVESLEAVIEILKKQSITK